ncbi:MAG: efflux RND transporter permease subunit, partial [Candidatus Hydrogenedentota bacterium]
VAMGDELRGIEDNQSNFFSLLLMAVLLIFIVMSALFESCLLPLSILTTVPMAFLGVIWLMFLTGTSMDTIAFIGCILMVGVVVNNGIVIVDHINQLRKEGLDRYDAIVQGGLNRLRPVLMTALTTILGAIPLAIGGRIGEPATVSLGMSMIGGLSAGTVLTLFVVPLFYSFIDDLQQWIMRFFGVLVSLRQG